MIIKQTLISGSSRHSGFCQGFSRNFFFSEFCVNIGPCVCCSHPIYLISRGGNKNTCVNGGWSQTEWVSNLRYVLICLPTVQRHLEQSCPVSELPTVAYYSPVLQHYPQLPSVAYYSPVLQQLPTIPTIPSCIVYHGHRCITRYSSIWNTHFHRKKNKTLPCNKRTIHDSTCNVTM